MPFSGGIGTARLSRPVKRYRTVRGRCAVGIDGDAPVLPHLRLRGASTRLWRDSTGDAPYLHEKPPSHCFPVLWEPRAWP